MEWWITGVHGVVGLGITACQSIQRKRRTRLATSITAARAGATVKVFSIDISMPCNVYRKNPYGGVFCRVFWGCNVYRKNLYRCDGDRCTGCATYGVPSSRCTNTKTDSVTLEIFQKTPWNLLLKTPSPRDSRGVLGRVLGRLDNFWTILVILWCCRIGFIMGMTREETEAAFHPTTGRPHWFHDKLQQGKICHELEKQWGPAKDTCVGTIKKNKYSKSSQT